MLLKHMKIDYRHTVEIVDGWNPETLRELLGNARRVVLTAHTNADGDAVGKVAVDLDGVAEGVAEVEYLSDALVVGVGADYTVLDARHLFQVSGACIGKHGIEQGGAGDGGGLHHLHLAVDRLFPWETLQEGWFYDS